MGDLTQLLSGWGSGDTEARNQLVDLVYDELHRVARSHMARERVDHTLDATALVHETYLRLSRGAAIDWNDRSTSTVSLRRRCVDSC